MSGCVAVGPGAYQGAYRSKEYQGFASDEPQPHLGGDRRYTLAAFADSRRIRFRIRSRLKYVDDSVVNATIIIPFHQDLSQLAPEPAGRAAVAAGRRDHRRRRRRTRRLPAAGDRLRRPCHRGAWSVGSRRGAQPRRAMATGDVLFFVDSDVVVGAGCAVRHVPRAGTASPTSPASLARTTWMPAQPEFHVAVQEPVARLRPRDRQSRCGDVLGWTRARSGPRRFERWADSTSASRGPRSKTSISATGCAARDIGSGSIRAFAASI